MLPKIFVETFEFISVLLGIFDLIIDHYEGLLQKIFLKRYKWNLISVISNDIGTRLRGKMTNVEVRTFCLQSVALWESNEMERGEWKRRGSSNELLIYT